MSSFLSAFKRARDLNWMLISVLIAIASIGFLMQYSAAGSVFPWVVKQIPRFLVGLGLMLCIAVTPLRFWFHYAYLLYFGSLILLLGVSLMGYVGMGARRWINLGIFNLQPSEFLKFTVILALARYFAHTTMKDMRSLRYLGPAFAMILVPVVLIARQPDLGTAILVLSVGLTIVFLAGLRFWTLVVGLGAVGASLPLVWHLMHDYQRQRVLTFLDPTRDPLGAGYHILQSKIALGSGGFWGKGYMNGSQSYLNFLPEKQTDFIFTMLCEEWGMFGGLVLILLYTIVMLYGYAVMMTTKPAFGKLVSLGITSILFLYMFINIAMVTGLLPVVGVPLPLVSYGGTQLMTLMMGFGLLLSCHLHAHTRL